VADTPAVADTVSVAGTAEVAGIGEVVDVEVVADIAEAAGIVEADIPVAPAVADIAVQAVEEEEAPVGEQLAARAALWPWRRNPDSRYRKVALPGHTADRST
jgi:hypothetical protein